MMRHRIIRVLNNNIKNTELKEIVKVDNTVKTISFLITIKKHDEII